jgi:hypothetical protein
MDNQSRNNNREWAILCHNIRGINSEAKWNSIKNKIKETNCEIIYLQEKREKFLISSTSGISAQEPLTVSTIHPPLKILGEP